MNCVHAGFLLDHSCAEAGFAQARSTQKTSALALIFIVFRGETGIAASGLEQICTTDLSTPGRVH
jgi:hypothetical protein